MSETLIDELQNAAINWYRGSDPLQTRLDAARNALKRALVGPSQPSTNTESR